MFNPKSLARASLVALKWDFAGSSVRTISSIAISIILARCLGPEPFGLVAVALLVIGMGNLVASLGLAPALVQRTIVSESDVRYTFTLQICMGIGLMTVVALSAPVVAAIFNQPKVIPVIQVMSLIFVLQTFGVVAVALLTRGMDFRRIQFARVVSYLGGFVILGIPLALLGFEVWSIVIAQIAQAGLFSMLSYLQVRHPIKPLFRSPSSDLNSFGFKVLLTNLINFVIISSDSFFIGRFFDAVVLGLYNRAHVLVHAPVNNLVASVQRVLFPAYSQMQDNPETVRRTYLAGVGLIALLMFPAYACVAVVPATIVDGLFGPEWTAAIPFLVPLALAMPFHAMMATGGPMLWAQNRVGRELVAQLFTALILVGTLLVTAQISAVALVWGVFACTFARFILVTHASLRTVSASWFTFFLSASGGLILLVPTAALVFIADRTLDAWHVPSLARLPVNILVGGGVFVSLILELPELFLSREMSWLVNELKSRLPTSVLPLMNRISLSAGFPVRGSE